MLLVSLVGFKYVAEDRHFDQVHLLMCQLQVDCYLGKVVIGRRRVAFPIVGRRLQYLAILNV